MRLTGFFSTKGLSVVAFSLISVCSASGRTPEVTSRADLLEAARMLAVARAAEQQGNIEHASMKYHTVMAYIAHAYGSQSLEGVQLGAEPVASIGKRTILLTLQMARSSMSPGRPGANARETAPYTHDRRNYLLDKNGERLDSRALSAEYWLNKLENLYAHMIEIEPNVPTWPYLKACMEASGGTYIPAYRHLEKCIATTGGEAIIREKAKKLKDHIYPGYVNQMKQVEEDKIRLAQYVESGQFHRNMARIWFNAERENYRKYGR